MTDPARRPPLAVDEYLTAGDVSPVRDEHVAGEGHALAGETRRHDRIALDVAARLLAAARGGPCRVSMEGVKLRVGTVAYPDVMVACGPAPADPRREDAPCLVTIEERGDVALTCPARTLALDEIDDGVAVPPPGGPSRVREDDAAYA